MLIRLLILFVTVPLVELVILLRLAEEITPAGTLAVVLVTGIVGASLARRQGWSTYARIQQDLANGKMPTESLLDAAMIFIAGALLVTPGVLTDIVGFSLLVPPCRRRYRTWMSRWIRSRFRVEQVSTRSPGPPDQIIDSYVVKSPTSRPRDSRPEETEEPDS